MATGNATRRYGRTPCDVAAGAYCVRAHAGPVQHKAILEDDLRALCELFEAELSADIISSGCMVRRALASPANVPARPPARPPSVLTRSLHLVRKPRRSFSTSA
jgi:hypothetical protein